MPITLKIRFSGLLLYTTQQGRQSVWIFAPETGKDAWMPMADHVLKLQVHDAHNPKRPPSAFDPIKFENLDVGSDIVIGDPGSPAANADAVRSLPVPRLDAYVGRGPRADLFGATPTDLRSRVVLHVGDMAAHSTGAKFRVRRPDGGNVVQEILTDLYWTMQVPSVTIDGEERVRIETRSFDGKTVNPIILRPVDGKVYVALHHVPSNHLPVPNSTEEHEPVILKKGQPTPHFIALYGLYDEPQDIMLPLFEARPPKHKEPEHLVFEMLGGEPVTCVGGGGGT